MAFGGTEEPAAYGEIVSIGGLNADVNKKLSAAVADILSSKLSVPKSRFFLKFFDAKASYSHLQRRVEKHPPTICYPSHLKIFFHLIESKRHPYLVGFNHPSNQHGGGKSQCPYSEKGDTQPETLLTHFNIFTPKGGIDGFSSLKIRGPITCAITRDLSLDGTDQHSRLVKQSVLNLPQLSNNSVIFAHTAAQALKSSDSRYHRLLDDLGVTAAEVCVIAAK
ncbi:macrophage migration inhibitory factor homolog isoform X2 [Tanacetum coccineum]